MSNCPSHLRVRLTRCRHQRPLVEVDNLPGFGAELRPDDLRQLAGALIAAADAADRLPADDPVNVRWLVLPLTTEALS